jgi:hypothetical protein
MRRSGMVSGIFCSAVRRDLSIRNSSPNVGGQVVPSIGNSSPSEGGQVVPASDACGPIVASGQPCSDGISDRSKLMSPP